MKEKIAVISAILLGLIVGIFATISLIIDIFVLGDLMGTIVDIIVMIFAYSTAWIGTRYAVMEKMAKDKLDVEWDYKIGPVVNLLRDTIGRINILEADVSQTNKKIDTTLDYVTGAQHMDMSSVYIYPGASFRFIIKVVVLMVFTFSALVYVSEYPLGIVHYFILVIYLLWWGLITSEYKLFNNKNAWMWALTIIMFIPALGMILDAIIGINNMIGILFFFMLIYVYSYYSWASYITVGFKLIDLTRIKSYIAMHIDTVFPKEKIQSNINIKWVNFGIFACITIAGAMAVWIFI